MIGVQVIPEITVPEDVHTASWNFEEETTIWHDLLLELPVPPKGALGQQDSVELCFADRVRGKVQTQTNWLADSGVVVVK